MIRTGELLAGFASGVLFILLLRAVGIDNFLWVALLALGLYFGIRLLLPTANKTIARPVEKPRLPQETLNAVHRLGTRLPPEHQRQVEAIKQSAQRLLDAVRTQPHRQIEIYSLVGEYLELVRRALERFLATSRHEALTASGQILGQLLDDVHFRFEHLHATHLQEDDAVTASELTLLRQTLHELDELTGTSPTTESNPPQQVGQTKGVNR